MKLTKGHKNGKVNFIHNGVRYTLQFFLDGHDDKIKLRLDDRGKHGNFQGFNAQYVIDPIQMIEKENR
jgi:hypothetical protein